MGAEYSDDLFTHPNLGGTPRGGPVQCWGRCIILSFRHIRFRQRSWKISNVYIICVIFLSPTLDYIYHSFECICILLFYMSGDGDDKVRWTSIALSFFPRLVRLRPTLFSVLFGSKTPTLFIPLTSLQNLPIFGCHPSKELFLSSSTRTLSLSSPTKTPNPKLAWSYSVVA